MFQSAVIFDNGGNNSENAGESVSSDPPSPKMSKITGGGQTQHAFVSR